jgi:ankyrin repeat protein
MVMAQERKISREKKEAGLPRLACYKHEIENRTPNPREQEALDVNLLLAALNGDNAKIERLLDAGANIEAKCDVSGTTALMHAAWHGKTETCALLIGKGANIEAKDESGYTPLMHAAGNGSTETCALLIGKGANIKTVDKYYGSTALGLAEVQDNNKGTVAFLTFATFTPTLFADKEASNSFYFSFRECTG